MTPLSTKVEFCRLYPKTDFYVFLVLNSAFECYSVNQTVYFRALVYCCFHVVHSALWSRMWSKLAPLKSTSGHLKIGQSIRCAVVAARRKPTEKKQMWSARKQPTEICGQQKTKPHGQAMWSEAFENRETNSHLKDFFFFRRCRIVT